MNLECYVSVSTAMRGDPDVIGSSHNMWRVERWSPAEGQQGELLAAGIAPKEGSWESCQQRGELQRSRLCK